MVKTIQNTDVVDEIFDLLNNAYEWRRSPSMRQAPRIISEQCKKPAVPSGSGSISSADVGQPDFFSLFAGIWPILESRWHSS